MPNLGSDCASIAAPKLTADEIITGGGAAIDIPRTQLSKGGKFGEQLTAEALRFATRREPAAKKLVIDVSQDIYDKWFKVVPISKADQPADAQNTLDQAVQVLLEKLQAKMHAILATEYERRYGWSIIIIGYKDQGADLGASRQPSGNRSSRRLQSPQCER